MKSYFQIGVLTTLGVLVSGTAFGDTVVLTDGSQLMGTIQQISDGKLVIATDFAGTLEIDGSKIKSLTTDGNVHVELASGDQLVGPVRLSAEAEGMVVESAVGLVAFSSGDIAVLWPEGGGSGGACSPSFAMAISVASIPSENPVAGVGGPPICSTRLSYLPPPQTALRAPSAGC